MFVNIKCVRDRKVSVGGGFFFSSSARSVGYISRGEAFFLGSLTVMGALLQSIE